MNARLCVDIDGSMYYLGNTVIVNGFKGHISELKSQGMKVTQDETDRIIRYDDINEIRKVELKQGEFDWSRVYLRRF